MRRSTFFSIAMITSTCLMTCANIVNLPHASADDWPQWQGINRDSISQETDLLQQWSADGPPLAWRIEGLGGGDGAPAVSNGMLFGMSNRDGKEIVWALAEADGSEQWATPLGDAVDQSMRQSQEGPACTPTVDGDRLYVIGMGGRVASLDKRDGKVIWQRELTEDFAGIVPPWSYRESPLIDREKLICTPGAPDAMVVALDKKTGETLWQTKMPSDAAANQSDSPPARPEPSRSSPARGGDSSSEIAGTKDSQLYVSEHWGMNAFAQDVPNGKYIAKLHFAETYQGIQGEGGRVFSIKVQDKQIADFDIFAKAGGPRRAYIETVPVEVTDGKFRIEFTAKTENPAIKAIELIPEGTNAVKAVRINAGAADKFTDSDGNVWQPDQGFEGGSTNPGTGMFAGGFGGRGDAAGRSRFGGGRGGFGGPRPGASYASAIAIDFEGQRQYVQLTAGALIGVSAEDGKVLWQYSGPANAMGINCSTPIYKDGLVFAASAYGTGGGAVKLVKQPSGEIHAEEVYFAPQMQNHHGGMIVFNGALYGANGGNGGGMLTCLDFQTGDVLWRDRDAPKGALALADGRLYLRDESGPVLLIEPSEKEFIERGRFEQPDRTDLPAWARPVIANGKLYLRDQGLLLCYDVRAK